jgi:hypothetical protein
MIYRTEIHCDVYKAYHNISNTARHISMYCKVSENDKDGPPTDVLGKCDRNAFELDAMLKAPVGCHSPALHTKIEFARGF